MADCLIVAISQLISDLHPGKRLVSQTLYNTLYINTYCAAEPGSNTNRSSEHLEDLPSFGFDFALWVSLAHETFVCVMNIGIYFPLLAISQATLIHITIYHMRANT